MEKLDLIQELPAEPEFTPDLNDFWTGADESVEAATGMVESLQAAGADDSLVSLMVMFIGLSILLGVLRRSINKVVQTGTDVVDREHTLSIERRRKKAQLGPYYIPPTPGNLAIGKDDPEET